ncbi:DNA internalization-related competence protein ComEC/Rec2 [Ferriphaselus sp. R-1]|uniref:DNA internalization-related competence protein ComEC/Rec2 n=1 Tax=Ferriphaselus sp. R-1 TaxID=1485544 RepID=UPI00055367D0|nr:DNA internalization-related competence protein ComEC/Rec2 [Ferriphaselus sp. R-1]
MIPFTLFFAAGVWWLQQQATLPEPLVGWLAAALAPAWLLPRAGWQRFLRWPLMAALACSLGVFHAALFAAHRLDQALPADWQGRDIEVVGVISELPHRHERGWRFVFDVEQVLTLGATLPARLQLATYDSAQDEPLDLHAGARWQLTVRLKRPHGSANPYGFDYASWLLERGLRATGYVYRKGTNMRVAELAPGWGYRIERWRENIRYRFERLGQPPSCGAANCPDLAGRPAPVAAPYLGVLIALAIGDQDSIPAAQWQVFTRTGVNHLMSISGLHITMLGGLAFSVVYQLWRRSRRLTLHFPARKAATVAGLLAALAYALLSGFAVPAQRTVYMLAAVATALLTSRNVAPSQLLAAALWAVLLADPWAVLAPGFWLSFGAVGLILYVTTNRLELRHPDTRLARLLRTLREYGRVQWALLIGLIPALLALFQQVSLVSPLANACAIPLVSLIVVPLTLAGAVLPFDGPLWAAHRVMATLGEALSRLAELPAAIWIQHAPPHWAVILGLAGALWALLPRGFPSRWLGLLMLLPLFLTHPALPEPGTLNVLVFDVGQGTAVAVQTHGHALLYDSGPDYSGEADSGNRILVPTLRALGISRLDRLVLSHDDIDHTGGAASVMQAMPVAEVASSLPENHPLLHSIRHTRCADGQHWVWDGIEFGFLHPAADAPPGRKAHDNDQSCVLRIRTGTHSVLLAGDIEKNSEERLLQTHADDLAATLLVAPHHGSKSSSHEEFVAATQPDYTVFTVGYRNRFGHPKDEVVERYRMMGSTLLRSDEDGAVLAEMDARQVTVERWRHTHRRYWHE